VLQTVCSYPVFVEVAIGRVGSGESGQFDLLEEIGSGQVNLHVFFLCF
jgi:hypothetical protein